MKKRGHLTQKQKKIVLARQRDLCSMCKMPLVSGLYQFDHTQALEHEGDNELGNWRAICTKPCHKIKTKNDHHGAAKSRHIRYGKPRKSAPMHGSRDSKTKRHFDGTWSYR